MNYHAFHIDVKNDILLALLSMHPFESFEEMDDSMIAYISDENLSDETKSEIEALLSNHNAKFKVEVITPRNWNAEWESSYAPVIVNDFCIVRADFHEKDDNICYDIIINPKMAFGTGHHETTYMMIDAMSVLDFAGKTVFDYGCGTGVLAILAAKLGAQDIDAIDVEEESYLNTIDNASRNNVASKIHAAQSNLDDFKTQKYDIILANINRQVLLDSATQLKDLLNPDGVILLSGILEEDVDLVSNHYQDAGFTLVDEKSKGYWKCLKLK